MRVCACACVQERMNLVLDTIYGSLSDAPWSLCPGPLGSQALPVVSMTPLGGWMGKSKSSSFIATGNVDTQECSHPESSKGDSPSSSLPGQPYLGLGGREKGWIFSSDFYSILPDHECALL